MLTLEEGEVLVKAGRVAIESHLSGVETPSPSNVGRRLNEERGVFVTLLDHSRGNGLRGCIGIPLPTRPLLEQVRLAGVEAATTDFRFRPLTLDELRNRITIEAEERMRREGRLAWTVAPREYFDQFDQRLGCS